MKSKTTIAIQRSRAVDKRHNANCEMSSFKETTASVDRRRRIRYVESHFLGQFNSYYTFRAVSRYSISASSLSNIILVGPKFGKLLGFSIFGFTYVVYRKYYAFTSSNFSAWLCMNIKAEKGLNSGRGGCTFREYFKSTLSSAS